MMDIKRINGFIFNRIGVDEDDDHNGDGDDGDGGENEWWRN